MDTDLVEVVEVDGVGLVSRVFAERRNDFFTACADPKTNPEIQLRAARRWYDSVDIKTEGEMSEFCRQTDRRSNQLCRANQFKS